MPSSKQKQKCGLDILEREAELSGNVEDPGTFQKCVLVCFLEGHVDISFDFCIAFLYLSVILFFFCFSFFTSSRGTFKFLLSKAFGPLQAV